MEREQATVFLVLATLTFLAIFTIYSTENIHPYEKFTALYLVPGSYPEEIESTENLTFRLGIQNHEGEAINYVIIVTVNGTEVKLFNLGLESNELKEVNMDLPLPINKPGRVRVSINLYKNGATEKPYRKTQFWVEVKGKE